MSALESTTSVNTLTKRLLLMKKSLLIKQCKKYKVSTFGTKKDMISRIIRAKTARDLKKKNKQRTSSSKKKKKQKAKKKLVTPQNVKIDNPIVRNKQNDIKEDNNSQESKFTQYMSVSELANLQINNKIDHRNTAGKFIGATIIDKNGMKLKIHYEDIDNHQHDIWSDFSIEKHKFAKYGTISKYVSKISSDLQIDDDVDINPMYNGHDGWRSGAIEEIDEKSSQVNVIYEIDDDDEYYTIWVDITNINEIAECGTKVDPLSMLKRHYYDPFFNLKKNKDNIELLQNKVMKAFEHIETAIFPEKRNELMSLVEYLNRMYYELYCVMICSNIKALIDDNNWFNEMKNKFDQMYSLILDHLKLLKDNSHLNITKDVYTIQVEENIKQHQIAMREIKMKWYTLNDPYNDEKEQQCYEHPYTCPSIARIKFLFEKFDEYFVIRHNNTTENLNEQMNENTLDFIVMYNHCINDNNQYSAIELMNDCHHIEQHHVNHIFYKYHPYLLPPCEVKHCPLGEKDLKFSYKSTYETTIIELMIKYHVYLKHKTITTVDPSSNLGQIKKKNMSTKSNKFVTKVNINETNENGETKANTNHNNENDETKVNINKNNENDETTTSIIPKIQFGERFFYSQFCQHYPNYIKSPKHKNLKEELLRNSIYPIGLSLFHSYLTKAINHCLCRYGRHLTANNYGEDNYRFEVPVDSPITISQLLCIIIYTDDDKLQRNFKLYGCRQNESGKSLEQRKELNSQIGHWYWLFSQTIYLYGTQTQSSDVLYHGLSVKLSFASFEPAFECPTSTTNSFSVAQGFAEGGHGIILELTPIKSSQDRYLSVQWLSSHPEESEYLFASASHLSINDIRFNGHKSTLLNSHKMHFAAMRLFDFIINKRCSYYYNIDITANSHKLLLQHLKCETNMDGICSFNQKNGLEELNQFIIDCQYDTDSIDDDISDIHSNVLKYTSDNEFKRYCKQLLNIPPYVQCLFNYMKRHSKEWVSKHENNKIHIIKSEYDKLDVELQSELKKLYTNDDMVCIDEFEWKIKDEEMIKFQALKQNESLDGPSFSWKNNERNDEFVTFHPIIQRSNASFVDYCSIGIQIDNVPSSVGTDWFCWSFSVKEVNYSFGFELSIEVENGAFNCLKAFQNKKLTNLSEFTVNVCLREFVQ